MTVTSRLAILLGTAAVFCCCDDAIDSMTPNILVGVTLQVPAEARYLEITIQLPAGYAQVRRDRDVVVWRRDMERVSVSTVGGREVDSFRCRDWEIVLRIDLADGDQVACRREYGYRIDRHVRRGAIVTRCSVEDSSRDILRLDAWLICASMQVAIDTSRLRPASLRTMTLEGKRSLEVEVMLPASYEVFRGWEWNRVDRRTFARRETDDPRVEIVLNPLGADAPCLEHEGWMVEHGRSRLSDGWIVDCLITGKPHWVGNHSIVRMIRIGDDRVRCQIHDVDPAQVEDAKRVCRSVRGHVRE